MPFFLSHFHTWNFCPKTMPAIIQNEQHLGSDFTSSRKIFYVLQGVETRITRFFFQLPGRMQKFTVQINTQLLILIIDVININIIHYESLFE